MFAPITSDLPAWCTTLLPAHIFWQFRLPEKEVRILSSGQKNSYVELLSALLTDLNFASTLISGEDFPRFKFFIQHLRQGKPDQLTFRLINQAGQWRSARTAFVALPGEPNQLRGYFLDLSDLIADQPLVSPDKTILSSSRIPGKIQPPAHIDGEEVDLPSLLVELCEQQKKSENPLFDALGTLMFNEDEDNPQWLEHGFQSEPLQRSELVHLVQYLKKAFHIDHPEPLIVNNTQNSHQPLDWAIFVRCGLFSYWIEPVISRKRIKGAMIFAARQAWAFHPDQQSQINQITQRFKAALLPS